MNQQINLGCLPNYISDYYAGNNYISPGFSKFIEFLQYKISGNKNIRIGREYLHKLYTIFKEKLNWEPLNRSDRRRKILVFKKFYKHKEVVQYLIQTCPEVYLFPIFKG